MEQDSNELVVAAPRRRLLRGAGAALVGAAGVAVAGSPASAAAGDAVVIGQVNDAGASSTTLTNSSADPALVLTNPSGPALRLLPTDFSVPGGDEWEWGTMAVDQFGYLGLISALGFREEEGGPIFYAKVPCAVYNSLWATTPVTVRPTRVLDTRDAAQRGNIVSGAENIDSSGRVLAGQTIVLSFDSYVDLGSAVHLNVTIASTAGAGFLTVWGTGSRPNASSLNWWRSGQILSNAVLSPLGWHDEHQSTIAIYCSQTTSVVVDLNGFDVAGPWQVHTDLPTGTPTAVTQQVKQARGKMPAYRRPDNRALLV